jgi:hypothetical protein
LISFLSGSKLNPKERAPRLKFHPNGGASDFKKYDVSSVVQKKPK